jgi:hypothetical protein
VTSAGFAKNSESSAGAAGEPVFEAEVKIGKGIRTLDRHGTAQISDGRLTLSKSKGDVIVDVAMGEFEAEAAFGGAVARIIVGGDKYAIEPIQVRRHADISVTGAGMNLAGDVKRFKQGKEMTEAFLAAIQSQGGQVKA